MELGAHHNLNNHLNLGLNSVNFNTIIRTDMIHKKLKDKLDTTIERFYHFYFS